MEEHEEFRKKMEADKSKEDKEREELLKKIGDIVKKYGGLEGNIPLTSEYWGLVNQYRTTLY
jgi:hypothetical protein